MLRTLPNATLANAQGASLDDLPVRLAPVARSRMPELDRAALGVEAEEKVDIAAMTADFDSQMTWVLSMSVPLAVAGATFLAYGTTLPSDTSLLFGALCIAAVVALQMRVRSKIRTLIIEKSVVQGLPPELGDRRASQYLKAWLG